MLFCKRSVRRPISDGDAAAALGPCLGLACDAAASASQPAQRGRLVCVCRQKRNSE
jgi:hypothetical protein